MKNEVVNVIIKIIKYTKELLGEQYAERLRAFFAFVFLFLKLKNDEG